ncbi:TlpA disulfide reductase family protein [Aliiglaciecola sp. LCG003]|uniref:TlpA family protein disulfide reductase n=1 Tax=Aliiglaciecola sp. LCG003 TaxID=3053655 RepID=UPI0025727664|nr:TlpA disulfide reductase family protein [Aliiglaciecola sp. LCG003]WJG09604.1 TlpA disulfide reductase family protein [Aliiglaciecola sp. LCG003]
MLRYCLLICCIFAVMSAAANLRSDINNTAAPVFDLADLNSEASINLQDYRGKVVYVDFWASSCFACRLSFPFLNKLQAEYAEQGFEIVAVNTDSVKQDALSFLEKYPLNYAVGWDQSGRWAKEYQVNALPTGFLLDETGKIRLVHLGFSPRHEAFLIAHVEKLLAEKIE